MHVVTRPAPLIWIYLNFNPTRNPNRTYVVTNVVSRNKCVRLCSLFIKKECSQKHRTCVHVKRTAGRAYRHFVRNCYRNKNDDVVLQD